MKERTTEKRGKKERKRELQDFITRLQEYLGKFRGQETEGNKEMKERRNL